MLRRRQAMARRPTRVCRFTVRTDFAVTSDAVSDQYDVAIDAEGDFVVVAIGEDSRILVDFFDAQGNPIGTESAYVGPRMLKAPHVAVSPATGAAVVTVQSNYSSYPYYLLFAADHTPSAADFVELTGVVVDGHTVGMNDAGQFVIIWRAPGDDSMRAQFFAADGTPGATVTHSTTVRPGETDFSDSFDRPHEAIPLAGANFVLPETVVHYATDTTARFFVYTPDGAEVSYFDTDHTGLDGIQVRRDDIGRSYFGDGTTWIVVTGAL